MLAVIVLTAYPITRTNVNYQLVGTELSILHFVHFHIDTSKSRNNENGYRYNGRYDIIYEKNE